MSKLSCNVTRDLLPNYIEHLTSEETNIEIEEHLSDCEECMKIKETMEEDRTSENIETEKDKNLFKQIKKRITRKVIGVIVICVAAIAAYAILTQIPLKRLSADDIRISADTFKLDSDRCEITDLGSSDANGPGIEIKLKDYNNCTAFFSNEYGQGSWVKDAYVFVVNMQSKYHINYYREAVSNENGETVLYIENAKTTFLRNKEMVSGPMLSFTFYSDDMNPEYKDISKVIFVNPDGSEKVIWTAEK
ncbi:MAG: zf-HC2 domain-containing protein, partial [Firmicutes bacterium]|nr:zf-HC2 domain-containing protein [Bacillota bacterium]